MMRDRMGISFGFIDAGLVADRMAYPFAARLRHDARRMGHLIETGPEGGSAQAGIVNLVSRRIHDASFAPQVELLLRVGYRVRFCFRPLD